MEQYDDPPGEHPVPQPTPQPTPQPGPQPAPGRPAPGKRVKKHEIGRRTYIVADVDPLDVDGVRTVAVGTVLWLVAFVLLLPFHDRLEETDRIWWLWTCVAGFGLGILGWDYCRRRRRTKAQHGDDGPKETSPLGAAG